MTDHRGEFLRGQRIDPRPISGAETVAELIDLADAPVTDPAPSGPGDAGAI